MSWQPWIELLKSKNFSGAAIIDRKSYGVLAQHGDAIPRGYKDQNGVDVNENTYLSGQWGSLTSIRFNQVKYMVLRKSDDEFFGKKGDKGIFGFKLKAVFIIGVSDSSAAASLSLEQAQVAIGEIIDKLKAAGQ